MTLIKICGLTSVEDALQVARMDVQIIGLVFAPSRRQVSRRLAAEISSQLNKLPRHPALAGVFVNENPHVVDETVRQCGLDLVQLSGDESWDDCRRISHPLIKAIHISSYTRGEDILEYIASGTNFTHSPIYMLDSKEDGKYGGTGVSFEWDIARGISASFPVIIAGGLDPQNVRSLIEQVRPQGVDVSSGVETNGRKDIAKIRAFIESVRSVEENASGGGSQLIKYIFKGEYDVT
ncbi:MAG: phosphoribosylanthranilate isomerase [Chloroflexi bacterium]|nr:phosphoribosylanthranilate isomerase [Chloroflexota bacterium]